MSSSAALWFTVVALGLFHGLNPAMGWPLAVANGMTARRSSAVFATLLPLGSGHFMAMAIVLVPFGWVSMLIQWERPIRIGAGVLVLSFGVYRLLQRRHPRALARIRPTQLAWWSFWMASAHGAGLMLLPFMLGLCATTPVALGSNAVANWPELGHAAIMNYLMRSNFVTALAVAGVHTLAMIGAGLGMAWIVYRYLGLRVLRSTWLNLDTVWGASLIVAGAAGVGMAF
ncbi:MAG TPA: hypothetical protein VIY30_05255 [Burkholderiaceae bacterium]